MALIAAHLNAEVIQVMTLLQQEYNLPLPPPPYPSPLLPVENKPWWFVWTSTMFTYLLAAAVSVSNSSIEQLCVYVNCGKNEYQRIEAGRMVLFALHMCRFFFSVRRHRLEDKRD